jgi:FtsP/CotA-like multicopper oxidase with cupredoxin domain
MAPNAGAPPFSDNNLINGKMDFPCASAPAGTSCTPNAGLAKFQFQTGKLHRLRLINAGGEGIQRFTIDGHNMTVIANDFVPVDPYETNMVTLGIGQRTDVIVNAIGNPNGAYWMRSDISANCNPFANQPHALAVIYYPGANTSSTPNSTATPYDDSVCGNVSKPSLPPHIY